MIPFNVPCSTGEESAYIQQALSVGHISGNGRFTHLCEYLLAQTFDFHNVYLTPSCTAALEMAALLCNFKPGDEVILPSFTHVSTANAFIRAGAVLKFGDCLPGHPNIDPVSVARLIGPKTKAVVVVHYAGIACNMEAFQNLVQAHGLILIEDAAHGLGARYRKQWLGTFGDFAAFSFHETKNINCGQGGVLIVNRKDIQAEVAEIWCQGTNRFSFERGESKYYTWTRPGGAFQLSDLNAAFLYPQLRSIHEINIRRKELWGQYYKALVPLQTPGRFRVPDIPEDANHNAHIFYLLLENNKLRDDLLGYLNRKGFQAVFHYVPLHLSPFALQLFGSYPLPQAENVASHLLRLPLYDSLSPSIIEKILDVIREWVIDHNAY